MFRDREMSGDKYMLHGGGEHFEEGSRWGEKALGEAH